MKIKSTLSLLVMSLMTMNCVYADGPDGIVQAIKDLDTHTQSNIKDTNQNMSNISKAEMSIQHQENYQTFRDPNLPLPNETAIQELASATTQHDTQKEITSLLSDFPNYLNPKTASSAANIGKALSFSTIASDTLQMPKKSASYPAGDNAPPLTLTDNVFNVDSLFAPNSGIYTTAEKQEVQKYLQFLLQDYQTIGSGGSIHFDKLRQLIAQNPSKKSQYLDTLQNNSDYQNYQLSARSKVAMQSLVLSNINALIAERLPVNDNGVQTSALAVARQKAARSDDPKWLAKVNTASPAAIQREQLQVLADIEQELYYSREINERLLMTSTITLAMAANYGKVIPDTFASAINNVIDTLDKNSDKAQQKQTKEQIDNAQNSGS